MRYRSGLFEKPQLNKKYPRVYGHHICAFSERVKLSFVAKELEFQNVEMDLESKAAWHLELNDGIIPVLEIPDGTLIHESRAIMQYASDLGGEKGLRLYDQDIKKRALQRQAME